MMLSRTPPTTRNPTRQHRVGRLVVAAAITCGVITVPAAARAAAEEAPAVTLSKVVEVKAAGISLRYPAAWTIVTAGNQKEALARRKAFLKANPKLATVYDEQAASLVGGEHEVPRRRPGGAGCADFPPPT